MGDRRQAGGLVRVGLDAVFDPAPVAALRSDSSLRAVGWTDADAVCVADAIASAAHAAGLDVRLTDADFAGVATVDDLVAAVAARLPGIDGPSGADGPSGPAASSPVRRVDA